MKAKSQKERIIKKLLADGEVLKKESLVTKKCPICNITFAVWLSRKDKARYCSRKCMSNRKPVPWNKGKNKNNDSRIYSYANTLKMKGIRPSFLGRTHSEETRKKISSLQQNIDISDWRGYAKDENARIRNSKEYIDWRKKVFKRDNYTCVICNRKSGVGSKVFLNADHIKPFAYYKELRFEIDNGRTLCKECHLKTETFGRKQYAKRNTT